MKDIKIDLTFNDIKKMSIPSFKNLVNRKIHMAAFSHLLQQQKNAKNGVKIKYNMHSMQDYLLATAPLIFDQKILLFSLRCESKKLTIGFTHKKYCEFACGKLLSNELNFYCKSLNGTNNPDILYEQVFNGVLREKIYITQIMEKNIIKRKEMLNNKSDV